MAPPAKKTGQIDVAPILAFEDPAQSMGYMSRVMHRRFARWLESRTIRHGVSSGQWRFLRVLWQEDGISQRELSRRVDMREPTTVVALKSLEKRGLVIRKRDTADRRKINVYLTDEARGLHDVLMPFVGQVNEIANRGISDQDIAIARRVIATMAKNLGAELASDSAGRTDSA